jgi:hypothetical protein
MKIFLRNINREVLSNIFLMFSTQIILFVFFLLLVSTSFFFLGISLNIYVIILSFFLSLIVTYLIERKLFKMLQKRDIFLILFSLLFIYLLSYFVAKSFYDISWDGQEYHQEIILQLVENKWNPYSERVPVEVPFYMKLWVQHYPKGFETVAASLVVLTGQIETGKLFNILLLILSFSLSLGVILKYTKISFERSLLLAFTVGVNPVSIYQSLSYYLDGQLSSLVICLLLLGFLLLKKNTFKNLLLFTAVGIIIINLKFSGILFVILGYFFLLLYSLFKKNMSFLKRFIFSFSITFLIGIFFIGYSSFILNLRYHNNAFYPVLGKKAIDVTSVNIPEQIRDLNNVEKFLATHFILDISEGSLDFRVPFTKEGSSLIANIYADSRIGGHGPFFMEIGIITMILFLLILFKEKSKYKKSFLAILFFLVMSVFLMPANWYARYVPTLFLIPWVILVYAFRTERKNSFLSSLLLFLLVLNSLTVGWVYINSQIDYTREIIDVLNECSEVSSIVVYSKVGKSMNNVRRFKEKDIIYKTIYDHKEWEKYEQPTLLFPGSELLIKKVK